MSGFPLEIIMGRCHEQAERGTGFDLLSICRFEKKYPWHSSGGMAQRASIGARALPFDAIR
jgi:ABC-type nitrate/sulfonate/bicarbonate transport system ATPase subunit